MGRLLPEGNTAVQGERGKVTPEIMMNEGRVRVTRLL